MKFFNIKDEEKKGAMDGSGLIILAFNLNTIANGFISSIQHHLNLSDPFIPRKYVTALILGEITFIILSLLFIAVGFVSWKFRNPIPLIAILILTIGLHFIARNDYIKDFLFKLYLGN